MNKTAGLLVRQQEIISAPSAEPSVHQVSDRKVEYNLFIWSFAIVAQLLLCIWMVLQASGPPAH